MKYALGNMLNGAGGLNADKLALDLQFAADKTLTARKGPTPTFTRASTGTFVGSNGLIQSAGNNVARFDHDPVTLESRGLLIEESRTNLVFPSDTLTTQTRTVTAVAHTLSFYGTGTVVLSGVHSATVVGTGAYPSRQTLTFTPTAGSLTLTVTGTVQFAQLEAGPSATSYIPTTTASVVRSADVCSITGAAFAGLWAGEATVLFSGMRHQALATSASRSWALHAGTVATEVSATKFGTQELLGISGNNILITGTIIPAFQQFKTAHAIKAADYAGSQNGLAVVTSNNATSLTPNAFNIGSGFLNTGQLNGTISAIRYYRRRLSNAKLQALTA